MNKQKARYLSRKEFSLKYRATIKDVRINTHNKLPHELAKMLVAWEHQKLGKHVVTEVIFNNGSRADVVILDDMKIIEILYSEKMENAKKKIDYYPECFDIEFMDALEILKDNKIKISD
jgi:hypothetical protein